MVVDMVVDVDVHVDMDVNITIYMYILNNYLLAEMYALAILSWLSCSGRHFFTSLSYLAKLFLFPYPGCPVLLRLSCPDSSVLAILP
jgi:hypothetical protein